MSLQPFIKTGAIGASLQSDDEMLVQNRIIELKTVLLSNETRPLADPRPCWVGLIRVGATEGVTIAFGYTSQYNDFVHNFPDKYQIGREDKITLSIRGDNGDVYKAKLLYSVVKLG